MEQERSARLDAELAADFTAVAVERSKSAFKRVFDFYAPRVKAYLRRLGVEDGAAEDLAQEVLLSVWRRATQFDATKASLSTWIFTIARNKRIDALRRDRRPDVDLNDPTLEPSEPQSGEAMVEQVQVAAQVQQAMAKLPEEQGRLVRIFYFEDKTHSAIAEELGLPLGTVKSRLRLALEKLRSALGTLKE